MVNVNSEGDEEHDDEDDGPPTPISVVKVPSKPPSMRPLPPIAEEPKKIDVPPIDP